MARAIGHLTFLRRGSPGDSKGLEAAAPFAYQVPMEEPSPRSSRLALAGALLAAIAVGGAGFLLGRSTSERPPAAIAPPVAGPAPKPAPEPVVGGVLGRADLIALAAAAADAAAAGREPGPGIAQADGRRFELRLPFGCDGPSGEGDAAPMRWRYDPKDQALRIAVEPSAWTAPDWWPADGAGDVEAVEGFWVERPWTSSEACPQGGDRPAPGGTEAVTLPGQTLAVGQIFLADSGRGGRRDGKPYEAVVRVAEDRLDPSGGFRLRISGRIARAGNAGPVHCRQPAGPEQRPICLVSVVVDEVAVENPASGETLATWNVGTGKTPET
jgi:hypothetical protein